MHIGVEIFPTDQTIGAIELAREVEAHGYESLWFPEHSHIPTSRATPVVAACERIGRDPATIELGVFGAPPDEAKLAELAGKGVRRAVFGLPQGPRDEVLSALEAMAPLVEAMRTA